MVSPFDHKHTDYTIVVLSLAPIVAQVIFGGIGAIGLCVNWLAAGLFSWIIWDIIEQHHLGLVDRNHAISISWALISMVLNFALINFNEYENTSSIARWLYVDKSEWRYLFQMLGFLVILSSMMRTWQRRVAPTYFLLSGAIIGVASVFLNYTLLWLILFPFFLYHMRSWSKQNWGSLFSGLILSIWIFYVGKMFIFGEAEADRFILSYSSVIYSLMPERLSYTFWEWVFMAFTALLLIIYSISGFAINVAKTVKAHSSVIMISTLSLVVTAFAIIDLSHLPNYVGIISILLSLQLAIHQSCLIDSKNEWWTIITLIIFAVLGVLPLFWSPF